ncbi:MAG: zinc ABC transporter solute-binding protein [Halieaceae bacterium]|jgi:zinc/manganese transport system substrate-binding protein|nr:zinc ABC transporter solute-binding protein [Halieaceae bacterium]
MNSITKRILSWRLPLTFLATLLASMPVSATVNIFTCEPEWAALAEQVGGDQVTTFSATTARQDPHFIQARPSLIAKVRKSDLIICSGADLEIGWLPLLLRKSGNRKIQVGTPGYLMATDYVRLLGRPSRVDRSQGDLHAAGNPHVHTDPRNMTLIAKAITDRLSELDPAHAAVFQLNFEHFSKSWKASLKQWKERARPLRDMPIAVLRNNWPYLVSWLKLRQVVTLEEKPGVPPTSSNMAKVLTRVQQQPVKAVIYAANQPSRAAEWLAGKADIPIVELPYTVGGNDTAVDLFSLYTSTIDLLLEVNQ